jgi:hypothetical protein
MTYTIITKFFKAGKLIEFVAMELDEMILQLEGAATQQHLSEFRADIEKELARLISHREIEKELERLIEQNK